MPDVIARKLLLCTAGMLAMSSLVDPPESRAQPQAAASPSFEVASIRPRGTEYTVVAVSISGPKVTITAYPLLGLLMMAYQVEPFQIVGGPSWRDSERYDILAKAEGQAAPTNAQVNLMLQALLADRFRLRFHRETRELPVYRLVVGKGGPKLKESAADAQSSLSFGSGGALQEITVSKGSMEQLARQLSNSGIGRPVRDGTGLTGSYDYKLKWLPGMRAGPDAAADTGGPPSIFTALQEQLGLKLESGKGPGEVLVIDHVEKPSEN